MTNRRHFIAGMLASGLVPAPTWADAGGPAYLAAAGLRDGSFVLCGIDAATRRRRIRPSRKLSPLHGAPAISHW